MTTIRLPVTVRRIVAATRRAVSPYVRPVLPVELRGQAFSYAAGASIIAGIHGTTDAHEAPLMLAIAAFVVGADLWHRRENRIAREAAAKAAEAAKIRAAISHLASLEAARSPGDASPEGSDPGSGAPQL